MQHWPYLPDRLCERPFVSKSFPIGARIVGDLRRHARICHRRCILSAGLCCYAAAGPYWIASWDKLNLVSGTCFSS